MKRVISISVAMILCLSLCMTLTACGSTADKDYVKWAETGVKSLEDAFASYQEKAPGAQSMEESLKLAEEYLAVLKAEKASLSKIDESKLNDANKKTFAEQMKSIDDGIATMESGIAQLKDMMAAAAQQESEPAEEAPVEEPEQDEPEQAAPEQEASGAPAAYYTGQAGNDSVEFDVAFSISPDGTQSVLGFGSPGDSVMVLGQIQIDGENVVIYPLDGSDAINMTLYDNGDGSLAIAFDDYEGSLYPVSEAEFNEVYGSLS